MSGRCRLRKRDVRDTRPRGRESLYGSPAKLFIATLYKRAHAWTIGSDPGLLRLRMALRTIAALACALLALYVMTTATQQPLSVALIGVVIAMIAAQAVDQLASHQQRITMALLPAPAVISIATAALLAPHPVAADVAFVVIAFAAVYIRRFGPRGLALGMVAFMAYFFALYLRAGWSQFPWMIAATLIGTLCAFVMNTYVMHDRPERVLRATIRSLRARMAIVIDTTADALRAGRFDEPRQRRMRARIARLNATALMVQTQIEDNANPTATWLGASSEQLAPWLFDAELAVEWVAIAGQRVLAVTPQLPAATRFELADAASQLAWAIRAPHPGGLRRAANQARQFLDQQSIAPSDDPSQVAARRLALAIITAATTTTEIRALVNQATTHAGHGDGAPPAASTDNGIAAAEQPGSGLPPTTRQAIQVSVAASLAIITGELTSPSRWYWAVIAAFMIFVGTNSWGETLTRGWQRLVGTILGVPCGVLVATLVSGNKAASLVMIFVCLFCTFYFMKVAYSLMTFWITTMLALLYGLLGQFSFDLLLMRIEETAIGAVIGVTVAIVVLPTNTRTIIRDDMRAFLKTLSGLIETSVATMFDDEEAASPTEQARELDRRLEQFRATAKPLLAGVAGFAGRRRIQRSLRLFTACDRYARNLARSSERYEDPGCSPELCDAVTAAAMQTQRYIDALVTAVDGAGAVTIVPAAELLDAAEALARQHDDQSDPAEPSPNTRRLLTALHSLRRIERAVVTASSHLGADVGLELPCPPEGAIDSRAGDMVS